MKNFAYMILLACAFTGLEGITSFGSHSGTAYAQNACAACNFTVNHPHHTEPGRYWMCEPTFTKLEERCQRVCAGWGGHFDCEIDYSVPRRDIRMTCAFEQRPGRHSSGGYRERHHDGGLSWEKAEEWCRNICNPSMHMDAENCRLLP
jgi:hypothetical protein